MALGPMQAAIENAGLTLEGMNAFYTGSLDYKDEDTSQQRLDKMSSYDYGSVEVRYYILGLMVGEMISDIMGYRNLDCEKL